MDSNTRAQLLRDQLARDLPTTSLDIESAPEYSLDFRTADEFLSPMDTFSEILFNQSVVLACAESSMDSHERRYEEASLLHRQDQNLAQNPSFGNMINKKIQRQQLSVQLCELEQELKTLGMEIIG